MFVDEHLGFGRSREIESDARRTCGTTKKSSFWTLTLTLLTLTLRVQRSHSLPWSMMDRILHSKPCVNLLSSTNTGHNENGFGSGVFRSDVFTGRHTFCNLRLNSIQSKCYESELTLCRVSIIGNQTSHPYFRLYVPHNRPKGNISWHCNFVSILRPP
jgi:hypothetical protein